MLIWFNIVLENFLWGADPAILRLKKYLYENVHSSKTLHNKPQKQRSHPREYESSDVRHISIPNLVLYADIWILNILDTRFVQYF